LLDIDFMPLDTQKVSPLLPNAIFATMLRAPIKHKRTFELFYELVTLHMKKKKAREASSVFVGLQSELIALKWLGNFCRIVDF
jgi:hypothetical protein